MRVTQGPVLRGRVWKLGDDIDTDVITPGDTTHFGLADDEEVRALKEHAFRAIRPGLHKVVRPGDILVAGRNFGLGSHREPATTVLIALGFSALIAESIARLYFRNSVAMGFHAIQLPGITSLVEEGDELQVDLERWQLQNLSTGKATAMRPYSDLVKNIIAAGGIIEVLKARITAEQAAGTASPR
jgi:3-isopropylmalate/(R)-2-methylmalate dehydratase small subunit